tara:strand:+ start:557 stop:1519 length:963 start_codon:yes stop_codon:yes gene_type:complete
MNSLDRLRKFYLHSLEDGFSEPEWNRHPDALYAPQRYILGLGGKRIRPILALMAAEAHGCDASVALPVAHAVERFHNFSLIHDDIMDKAKIRRGKKTVHENWGMNTGILSGDALLVMAYKSLLQSPAEHFSELLKSFNQTALEVCEGQQMDMSFEKIENIEEGQYLHMIRNKTAVLLGCSLEMGSIISGGSKVVSKALYNFGIELGMSFQIHDDLLDAYGSTKTIGKNVGADILAKKKTLLWVHFSKNNPGKLNSIFDSESDKIVQKILSEMESSGTRDFVEKQRRNHFDNAMNSLKEIEEDCQVSDFRKFANWIYKRKF